eukprot:GFUD01017979.1.p1 GENE.GFUD01017979.1~~GFUD01017979.1.p1  ORF type:complete len:287 (-),score=66.81 GFUD01017979.1:202-1062(-)
MGSKTSQPLPPPPDLFSEPWRKVSDESWTIEVCESLKQKIAKHEELLQQANMKCFNVLLVGQISAGKSSLFNTVDSSYSDHVTHRADAGSTEGSLTTRYQMHKVKELKFKFCDSMGLEGGNTGLTVGDVGMIMDGHARHEAELEGGLGKQSDGYNPSPTVSDQIHCVAVVIDAERISLMDEKLVDKIKGVRREANRRSLNPIVLLTGIDAICKETGKDTTKVFLSKSVKEKVQEVSNKFGINENMIHPVRNYVDQTETELGIDILMLLALQQILRCAQDFIKNLDD